MWHVVNEIGSENKKVVLKYDKTERIQKYEGSFSNLLGKLQQIAEADIQQRSTERYQSILTLHKKWSFPLKISYANVTKPAATWEFGHIYWRHLKQKTSFFIQWEDVKFKELHPWQKSFKIKETPGLTIYLQSLINWSAVSRAFNLVQQILQW